jgi:hypothetical protein
MTRISPPRVILSEAKDPLLTGDAHGVSHVGRGSFVASLLRMTGGMTREMAAGEAAR